ncbi:hypothetical protein CYMTET_19101 [Cymbomonas tetramitiformis]|uniref:Uncharacterized protein n=1 Tax=Cymbomonas tetramitiformis TaxID=36881 RepID=A0AAE0L5I5_9CHLO|nr:hypothetical protein CYMTET_19101 [Cymbomonas tetramitiformis]
MNTHAIPQPVVLRAAQDRDLQDTHSAPQTMEAPRQRAEEALSQIDSVYAGIKTLINGRWEDDDARRSGTAALDPAPTSTATSIADGFLSNPWMAMFDREEAANEIALNSLGLADRLMPPSAPAWPPLRELPEESKTNTGPRNAAPLPDCWDRPGQQSSEADTVGEQHGDGMASSGSYPMHAFPVAARLHSNHQDDSTATSDSFTADGGWDFDEILRDR